MKIKFNITLKDTFPFIEANPIVVDIRNKIQKRNNTEKI